LKKLLQNFDEKSRHIAHESLIGLGIHSFGDQATDPSKDYRNARAERDLGLPEFEDLYYLLACKTRALYSNLQIRFASGFITKDTLLYEEKDRNSKAKQSPREPCTVRYLRNMLRALWFHLLHPKINRTIEAAINKRKYQHLRAHPLVPANFYQMEEDEHNAFNKVYKMGSNLDALTLSTMFQHLEDVSALSIPAMLDKIFKRRMVYQAPPVPVEAPSSNIKQSHAKVVSWRDSWINLKEDEESYIEQEIERAKSSCEYEEHEQKQAATTIPLPLRTTSLIPATVAPLSPTRRLHNEAAYPVTAVKVQKWLPEVVTLNEARSQAFPSNASHTPPASPASKISQSNDSRITVASPSSKYSRSNVSHKAHSTATPSTKYSRSVLPTTPSTTIKTQSITDSPSSRRLPFHGDDEYMPPPPLLPPKSHEQLEQAAQEKEVRDRQLRYENERLKRENSQLQEALQQVQAHDQKMEHEPSGLREALQQIQNSPGEFMRRLSKAGSRARSKSPFKSSRKSLTNPAAEMSTFDMRGRGRTSFG
jgi:hypothetical protein